MSRIQAIGLERDYGLSGSGSELAIAVGSYYDVAVVNREIDKLHRRQRSLGKDDAANGHGCHQSEAFIPGQLL
jgi:hypothetical protein